MNNYETLNVQTIIDRAATVNIKTNLWEKHGRCRLYADAQKGMAVYLDFDGTSNDIMGAAYKVFCNIEQHPNWQKSQIKEHREAYMGLFYAYVVEFYKDADLNQYGPDLTGLIEDARAFFKQEDSN
mgnify:CR=1 FL=1|tara:strand:- start:31 stop:408 length:378 start_codon:yes stop_codon:yes gene_type:complete